MDESPTANGEKPLQDGAVILPGTAKNGNAAKKIQKMCLRYVSFVQRHDKNVNPNVADSTMIN